MKFSKSLLHSCLVSSLALAGLAAAQEAVVSGQDLIPVPDALAVTGVESATLGYIERRSSNRHRSPNNKRLSKRHYGVFT